MSAQLTRFRVIGLHGHQTMDVRLEDNKLILVGENGTGKSTFANLIYFFLTRQWRRLHEYRFASIEAVLGDQYLTVTPEQIDAHYAALDRASVWIRRMPTRMAHALRSRLFEHAVSGEHMDQIISTLAEETGMPERAAREYLAAFQKKTKDKPTELKLIEDKISSAAESQFLYLPTYRRIEQDLRSIFKGVEIEAELRRFKDRLARRQGAPFIEFVEFGMEDVEQLIVNRMTQIKESVRTGLDNLTGTYLRDVIRGVHTKVDVQRVRDVDSKTLDAIFERIDEATLPASDKERLQAKVATISTTREIEDSDKVIAHFLSKLIELHTEQQAREKNVREFVELCNRYLSGKQLVYDNTKYTISIRLTEKDAYAPENLEMKMLSSGEKQIVSLFCHLYLSGEKSFFVIIDEPELSLSVPWQRRFLPDIIKTGMCSGIIAVTHSPFVWDNELERYVRSLAELTEPYHDIH